MKTKDARPAPRSDRSDRDEQFRVGRWTVTPARNKLTSSDYEMSLEPKVMRVLEILIARHGEVVSRTELESAVWPNAVIGEKTLTRAISELRKAFDDAAEAPTVVETVARRGYRLMQPAIPLNGRRGWRPVIVSVVAAIAVFVAVWIVTQQSPERLEVQSMVRLTSERGHELTPAASPTGELIAYAKTPKGETSTSIFVQQRASEVELRLTRDAAFDVGPRWSPDGSQLAFLRFDDTSCAILVSAALGGEARQVASCRLRPRRVNFAPTLDWSPDGSKIAYVDRLDATHPSCIMVADMDRGTTTVLNGVSMSACAGDVDPAFSPDGQMIAFTRYSRPQVGDLHVADLRNETVSRLTSDYAAILGATWDSDQSVVVSSNRSSTYRLWRVDVATGDMTWLPAPGDNIKRPNFGVDGTVVYENWQYDTNIWSASLDNPIPQRLIASTVWDFSPAVSHDGRRIAYVSNRSGNFELWVLDPLGNERQLTHSANRVIGYPSWSPEGDRLAYVLQIQDRFQIVIISLNGAELLRIPGPGNAMAPVWAPDGQQVIFSSDASSQWEVWSFSMEHRTRRQLTTSGGNRGVVSAANTLYFTKPGVAGIWRQPEDASAPRVVLDLDPTQWANWQLIGDTVVSPTASGRGLQRSDLRAPNDTVTLPFAIRSNANVQSVQTTAEMDKALWVQLDHAEADIFLGRLGVQH